MQTILPFVAGVILSVAASLTPASPRSVAHVKCEEVAINPERIDLRCALTSDQMRERYRLEVHFSGGHDDTSASLSTLLNGVPLTCGPDSKTKLFGEDGEIKLWCDFEVGAPTGHTHRLEGVVVYRHAQYSGTRILPQARQRD